MLSGQLKLRILRYTKGDRFITESTKCHNPIGYEWLKYHGFKHVNEAQIIVSYAGYDYGDSDFVYHVFPLYEAINNSNPDIKLVKSLLEIGADPNFQTKMTLGSVLYTILVNDNWWNDNTVELLALLIKYGANVNFKDKNDKSTPLHQVALSWTNSFSGEIIKLLIKNGAKINTKDNKGKIPYDNVLSSSEWHHRKNLKIPEKILDLLKPSSENEYNYE